MQHPIQADIAAWDEILDHRTGSSGDAATSAWLASAIAAVGAVPHIDAFSFDRLIPQKCSVTIDEQCVDGVPLFDCLISPLVEAPLCPLAIGKGIGVTTFSPSARHPGTEALLQAREKNLHQGIVAISEGGTEGLSLLNADQFSRAYGPPVLQVDGRHKDSLMRAATNGLTGRMSFEIDQQSTQTSNVQTTVRGTDPSLAPLVIMTPKSAWWTCTAERSGGIVAWLACIRHFAANPPRRNVLFTANTGHELGHTGLEHYLREHKNLGATAHAWIHLGANLAAVDSILRFQPSNDELSTMGITHLAAVDIHPGSFASIGARPGGEACNIYDEGGQYLSLLGSNRWFHHPDDRWPHSIDLDRITRITDAVVGIAKDLAA
ncbi:MAG: hypothetical protein VX298_04145 [Pseudomonadota bacterium]|nr:hypothetical protein [Pseudomonadota bacterium]